MSIRDNNMRAGTKMEREKQSRARKHTDTPTYTHPHTHTFQVYLKVLAEAGAGTEAAESVGEKSVTQTHVEAACGFVGAETDCLAASFCT